MKYNEIDVDFLRRVELLAREGHKGQTRKDGEDFINHPARVVYNLLCRSAQYMNSEEFHVLIALGWLHDLIEDTDFTLEEIEVLYGKEISSRLDLLTKRDNEDYYEYGERIIQSNDTLVYLVKLCDLGDNLSKIGDGVFSKEKEDKLKKRWEWLRKELYDNLQVWW